MHAQLTTAAGQLPADASESVRPDLERVSAAVDRLQRVSAAVERQRLGRAGPRGRGSADSSPPRSSPSKV
jgi:hypothetical protein